MELILSFVLDKKKLNYEFEADDLIMIDNKFEELCTKINNNNYKEFIEIYKKTNFEKKNQWQFILEHISTNNDDFNDFHNYFNKEHEIDYSRVLFFETYKNIINILNI